MSLARTITPTDRSQHLRWLHEVTPLPTAAGREFRVIAWIESWVKDRDGLELTRDAAGNMHVRIPALASLGRRPVYFTAHLDHPAFVVERVLGPHTLEVSFRGGVMAEYFKDARVRVHPEHGPGVAGVLRGTIEPTGPDSNGKPPAHPGGFKHYELELDDEGDASGLRVGDVGVWDFPPPEVIGDEFHTLACDDLAALVAALGAYDVLWQAWKQGVSPGVGEDVRLLFTRAEEIGFVGAIAAAKGVGGSPPILPRDARVLALENSRAFPESPIGAGPIVRVGDRLSVFTPTLTAAVAKRAEEHASQMSGGKGGSATVTVTQKLADLPAWKWQRKLMAGGACEASVFCHAGFDATCVCLPLGNYHNMGDLASVQAGTNTSPPLVAREFISVGDFHGLVDLLVACGERLPEVGLDPARFDKLWNELNFVLA